MKIDAARDNLAAQLTQHYKLRESLGVTGRKERIMIRSVIIARRKDI